MNEMKTVVCITTLLGAIFLAPGHAAAQPEGAAEDAARPDEAELESRTAALELRSAEVEKLAVAAEETQVEREKALTSFVQLLGDARAQTATSGETSAAFGGGILYRGQNQSILILARADADTDALDTQAERGALMLTPESTGQPSFEFDWRVYFFCMNGVFKWRSGACADGSERAGAKQANGSGQRSPAAHDPNMVDFGIRLYMSGGTADWAIPAADPMEDPLTHRASVLAYGADVALRREFIKGLDNYVALEAGLGITARNLIGDLTADENRADLEAFLGTDRTFYGGPELYISLTINALNLGISLPIIPFGEVDGFSGGQLLVTAIVRDGPKLVIPD